MTLPQIEIMMSDLPHTLYLKTDKDGKKKKKVSKEDYDKAAEINRRLAEKARKRREAELTVDDVFNGKLENEEKE